ncbi:MAG: hypothetical protein AAF664_12870, partial [Planctomycetota bacterium]
AAVVIAWDMNEARYMHPLTGRPVAFEAFVDHRWCESAEDVEVQVLGNSIGVQESGVVLVERIDN